MQLAGSIMAGAQGYLLTPSIPYRFFFAAGFYHLVGWALVLTAADQAPAYQGGSDFILAALHALTLGVFTMTAMGASMQILPVVMGRSMTNLWPIRLASWLFIPGVGVLIAGFAYAHDNAMSVGGIMVSGGLGLYLYVVIDLLRRSSGFAVMTRHVRLALVALVTLVIIGLSMIFDFSPVDRITAAAAHGTVAVFGFMGLFAMGFAAILAPMFALANPAPQGRSMAIMALYCGGLIVAVYAVLSELDEIAVIGAGLLLIAAVGHAVTITGVVKKGMKKKLGISFILIRASWVLFPVSLATGLAAMSGFPFERTMLMAGYLAVFGWLLTFVLGVLQQIVPFLAAMNASAAGGRPPRLSQLARGRPVKIHAVCHFSALALAGVGIAFNLEIAVQAGAALGLVGAAAFIWFITDVYRRMLAGVQTKERPRI